MKPINKKQLEEAIAELNKTGGGIMYADNMVDAFGHIGIKDGKIWAQLGAVPHYVASAKGVKEEAGVLICKPHPEDIDRKRRLITRPSGVIGMSRADLEAKIAEMKTIDEAQLFAILNDDKDFDPEQF